MHIACVPPYDHSALQTNAGVNTGILLLRNDDDFSPMLWDDIAHVSRINQKFNRSSTTAQGRIKVRAAPETHAHKYDSQHAVFTCNTQHVVYASDALHV